EKIPMTAMLCVLLHQLAVRVLAPRYGRRMMSLWTMTRSGQPGRTVMVGWTLRWRSTRRWPARLVVDCVESWSARMRSLSPEPRELAADTKHGRQRDTLQQLPGVKVDLIGEAGIAAGVRRRQTVDDDGRAIGKDHALPDDERALLAECDDVVVFAD